MRYKNYLTELKIKSPSKPKDEIEKVKLKLKNPTEILKEFDKRSRLYEENMVKKIN